MKIAIVGAGFTGLAAALRLSSAHTVTVFEKEAAPGGLAGTFKRPSWEWPIEQHYHHWFTNDSFALSLIDELGMSGDVLIPKTKTSWYTQETIYPFNSALDVLSFPPLSPIDRLRTGAATAYLKALPQSAGQSLERYTAHDWLRRYYGEKSYAILWEPLLRGKFGPYAKTVNMAWFWARVKKRTPRLAYLAGGYHRLIDAMVDKITENGAIIRCNTPFEPQQIKKFDATIITTPSAIFLHLFPSLPTAYRQQLTSIPHLHAINLVYITKEKILPDVYWLSISDASYPFLAVIQQTNMVDASHYGGNHITYVANYLPPGHPYLKMSKEELHKTYFPYLKKINPRINFQPTTDNLQLFFGPFAQPVFLVNYSQIKPDFVTPIKNVYLANMDMVYPWDRGTNYAIELGYTVARIVEQP